MIIYKDEMSGDELFTDALRVSESEDGLFICFDTKMKTQKKGCDVQLAGANPSAEDAPEEQGEEETESGFEFVLDNRLQEYPISDKKSCGAYFKGYFKALLEYYKEKGSEDKCKCLKEKALQEKVQEIMKKAGDMSFFQGESNAENPLLVMVDWNDDGVSGKAYAFKVGVKQEKV